MMWRSERCAGQLAYKSDWYGKILVEWIAGILEQDMLGVSTHPRLRCG